MAGFDEVLAWLLEDDCSLTRYNSLIFLLDRPLHDSEVLDSLSQMLNTTPILDILSRQQPDGGYETKASLKKYRRTVEYPGYLPKYKASTWEALFLAQASVPPNDPRIQALGEYLLEKVYSRERGPD